MVFDYSRTDTSYFFSEAGATSSSSLDRVQDRVRVTDVRFATPPNALRLTWTARMGGNWHATIRTKEWRNRPVSFEGSTLAFSV